MQLSLPVHWTTELSDWITLGPFVIDGVVIVRTAREVMGLEPSTGAVIWREVVDDKGYHSGRTLICYQDCMITDLIPDRDSWLVAVHPQRGVVWQTDLNCRVNQAFAVVNDKVYGGGTERRRARCSRPKG